MSIRIKSGLQMGKKTFGNERKHSETETQHSFLGRKGSENWPARNFPRFFPKLSHTENESNKTCYIVF